MEIDSMGWASAEPPTALDAHEFQQRQSRPPLSEQNRHRVEQPKRPREPESAGTNSAVPLRGVTHDRSSWQQGSEAHNCGFREKGQHLLILWRFLQSISFRDLKLSAEAIRTRVHSFWLHAAASLRSPSRSPSSSLTFAVGSFLSDVFAHSPVPCATYVGSAERDCNVTPVTAQLFLRALLSPTVQRLVLSACTTTTEAESSTAQLQERFLLLISDVYDALDDILHEVLADAGGLARGGRRAALPALVDDVLSLVYGQPRFRQVRAGFVALLMDQQAAGSLSTTLNWAFQTFAALAREGRSTSAAIYRDSRYSVSSHGDDGLLWNQRWLLEPGSVQFRDVAFGTPRDCRHETPLVDVVQLIYEFGCVDINVEEDVSWLSLRSAVPISASASMTLVLDGKLRVFGVLPSGVPSSIPTAGGWSIGDYTAALSEDGHSVEVNLFSFSEEKANGFGARSMNTRRTGADAIVRLRRVCLSIRLEEELDREEEVVGSADQSDLFAFVHGTVYGSTLALPLNECLDGIGLAERPAVDRAATWSEVEWAPVWKLQAGFIALPHVGFV
ncbi:hypothetical protein PHYPSEUDO_011939 [Phytophthora pseudosyringae]|uniref:Uncharacterized protein n=1 Tax=Phytophthora pseudosyringae TaxID=221518 RepID=A0A8T1VB08_9STRA|nr:hypothetical protein PHYPSEUDO_011939 [Phytophthora pseudosyringae]